MPEQALLGLLIGQLDIGAEGASLSDGDVSVACSVCIGALETTMLGSLVLCPSWQWVPLHGHEPGYLELLCAPVPIAPPARPPKWPERVFDVPGAFHAIQRMVERGVKKRIHMRGELFALSEAAHFKSGPVFFAEFVATDGGLQSCSSTSILFVGVAAMRWRAAMQVLATSWCLRSGNDNG